ncbi:MAG: SRPBCC domain-containing protein, partial [Gemmatimonadales bacterium]
MFAADHHTFVIERTFPKPRARVFAALSTPATVRRWYLESDSKDLHSFDMDFRVGGVERATYQHKGGTPVDGVPFVNEGHYLDIVPLERIVSATAMTAG